MIHDQDLVGEIDYQTYRFGRSKNLFRGPAPDLSKPYVAVIGSSEAYGKFIPKPFPALLQEHLGISCANFSRVNSGIDLVLKDAHVQAACASADVTVITVMGAHNMSNRMYRVHPRKNDRFIGASAALCLVYPDVDFTDIHYTRHLLQSLLHADPDKFAVVLAELKKSWVARMTSLIERLDTNVILLWMSNQPPKDTGALPCQGDLGFDPLFVDQQMLDRISPLVARVVEVTVSLTAQQQGAQDMVYQKGEKSAALKMFGPSAHKEAAAALLGPVTEVL